MNGVLITRPEPGASQTAARVSALGLNPILAPVFTIVSNGPLDKLPMTIAATILTSRNAVEACPAFCHDRPVYTVGHATARFATTVGFKTVESADGDANALAALIADRLSPVDGSLFLPVGRRQGERLTHTLRRCGFHVIRRVAYETQPVPILPKTALTNLIDHQLVTAMFFSTETADHFVHLVLAAGLADTVRDVEAVSISDRSAVALRRLHWRRINVAARPTQDAMLALL